MFLRRDIYFCFCSFAALKREVALERESNNINTNFSLLYSIPLIIRISDNDINKFIRIMSLYSIQKVLGNSK